MARVVIDPSVLVSALITPLGSPASLWQAVRDERIGLITSPRVLAELAGVLVRPKFRRYVTIDEVNAFVAEVAQYGTPLTDSADAPAVTRDPNDDYLVALAQAGHAQAIVSGDRDLTELVDHDPPVLTPVAAVAQFL